MDSEALVVAMAELSRAATGTFSVEDMLRRLCEVAADALDVDGVSVMARQGERHRFVHASTTLVVPFGHLQELLQTGPCIDSHEQQQPVAVADLTGDVPCPDPWGRFRELAGELGLNAVLAVPLLSRGQSWGVLDLYRRSPGLWTEQDRKIGRAHV